VFTFVAPTSPYSDDPRYDLDMASYSLVASYGNRLGELATAFPELPWDASRRGTAYPDMPHSDWPATVGPSLGHGMADDDGHGMMDGRLSTGGVI
jgi:hypothetical protein